MSVAPGWYRDPAEPTTQRWWDGEGWIGDPLPADQTPPPGPPPERAGTGLPGTGQPGDRPPQVPEIPGVPGAGEPPPEADRPGPGRPARPGQPGRAGPGARVPGGPYQRPAADYGTPPRPHGYLLASLGARLVARLVDIGLVLALNVAVNGWFVYQFWTEISPVLGEAWRRSLAGESMSDLPQVGDQAGNLQITILVLAAALWFAYEVPAIANTGQTPGKRLLRIKVVRLENGQPSAAAAARPAPAPLGFGRSFRRWNTMGLPTLLWWCFGIGFLLQLVDVLFALFDRPLQQALHDKSAHTAVVSVAAGPPKETPDEQADPS